MSACTAPDDQESLSAPRGSDRRAPSGVVVEHRLVDAFDHTALTATLRVDDRDLDATVEWNGDVLSARLVDGDVTYSYLITPERFLFKYKSASEEGGYSEQTAGSAQRAPRPATAPSVYERLRATTPTEALFTAMETVAARAGRPDLAAHVATLRERTARLVATADGFPASADAPAAAASEPTGSPTASPTATVAPTPTATVAPTPTATVAPTPTATVAPTPTATVAPTPTATVTPSPSPSPSPEACDDRYGLTEANAPSINATIGGVATLSGGAARAAAGASWRKSTPIGSKGMMPNAGLTYTDGSGPCVLVSTGGPSNSTWTGKQFSIFARVMPKPGACDNPPTGDNSHGPEISLTVPGWVQLKIEACSQTNPTGTSASAEIGGDSWICRNPAGAVTGQGLSGGWRCQ